MSGTKPETRNSAPIASSPLESIPLFVRALTCTWSTILSCCNVTLASRPCFTHCTACSTEIGEGMEAASSLLPPRVLGAALAASGSAQRVVLHASFTQRGFICVDLEPTPLAPSGPSHQTIAAIGLRRAATLVDLSFGVLSCAFLDATRGRREERHREECVARNTVASLRPARQDVTRATKSLGGRGGAIPRQALEKRAVRAHHSARAIFMKRAEDRPKNASGRKRANNRPPPPWTVPLRSRATDGAAAALISPLSPFSDKVHAK